jgi:conserved oligomeric Golgi complex subunit 2
MQLLGMLQVSLDALAAQLTSYAETLRGRLVEVVNADYDEFVSLSTRLVDVDSAAMKVGEPLKEVLERLQEARAAVALQASTLQDGLARRQAAASARALLELAQDAVHVMAKIEKLSEEVPLEVATPAGDADHEALEARCRLLDRLASEVSRINYYAQKGADLAAVRALEPRRERAVAMLHAALARVLEVVLEAQNPVALAALFHAYGSLGWVTAAEAVVRRCLIAPVVRLGIDDAKARQAKHDGSASPSFAQLLSSVETALRDHTGPFLQLALSPSGSAAAFDFLGGAVLPEAVAQAQAACPGAYSPGLPDAFFENISAFHHFLDFLEGMCVTPTQVEHFRGSQACEALHRQWNLNAYFSLRFQDIAGALESVLSEAGPPDASVLEAKGKVGGAAGFSSPAASATWDALQASVRQGIFLRPLGDKFTRLVAQIVCRFAIWVREGISIAMTSCQKPVVEAPEGSESHAMQSDAARNRWRDNASAEQLIELWLDIKKVTALLHGKLEQQLLFAMGVDGPEPQVLEAVSTIFDDAEAALEAASECVITAAAGCIVENCCEALKQLRGIVATFRMTQRAAPTRPAQYATTVLVPLQRFLSTHMQEGGLAAEEGRAALARAVVAGVAHRYCTLAADTLTTVRKTESSLRRLKGRKEGEGGAAQDTDKLIALQLGLDVKEFGRQAAQCGVDANALEAFELLEKALLPVGDDDSGGTDRIK